MAKDINPRSWLSKPHREALDRIAALEADLAKVQALVSGLADCEPIGLRCWSCRAVAAEQVFVQSTYSKAGLRIDRECCRCGSRRTDIVCTVRQLSEQLPE